MVFIETLVLERPDNFTKNLDEEKFDQSCYLEVGYMIIWNVLI